MKQMFIEKRIGNDFILINYSAQSMLIFDKNGKKVWDLLKALNYDFDKLKKMVILPAKERPEFEKFVSHLQDFFKDTIGSQGVGISLHKFFIKKDVPLLVGLEINQTCQMRCRHCYNASNIPNTDLPIELIDKLSDDLVLLGTPYVVITGGEPLLHPDFLEICRLLTKKGLAVKVFTNGFAMTESIAKSLADMNVFQVGFTLFGHNAELHEYISRVPSSFKRIVAAIEMVREYQTNTDVTFFFMKHNFEKRQEMFEWARKELGIEASFSFSITPSESGSLDPLELEITQEQQYNLFREQDIHYDPLVYGNEKVNPCMAGKALCAVKFDGTVTPCVSLLYTVGDLKKERFLDIWRNSPEMKKFKFLKLQDIKDCNRCENNQFCLRCYVSAAFLNNVWGKDPHACRIAETIRKATEKK